MIGNHLIESLASAERRAFSDELRCVDIAASKRLAIAGRRTSTVYFPIGAVISGSYSSNGRTIEVQSIGREGMIGCDAFYAVRRLNFDLVCHVAGQALILPRALFEHRLQESAALQQLVAQHCMVTLAFQTQLAACTGLHSIAQRCARWLLTTADRVGASHMLLTHEAIAECLGAHRPGVSIALSRLQQLNIISYRAGRISIMDRDRLGTESCECYRLITSEWNRILNRSSKPRQRT